MDNTLNTQDASQYLPEQHPFYKIRNDYEVGTDDQAIYDWLRDVIPKIQLIGDYKDSETPFDQFDGHCHQQGSGIATSESKYQIDEEDELIFLINLSEHVKRPEDMLMFLGEYFKQSVSETLYVNSNNSGNDASNRGKKKQDKFFVTTDVINYLGTACKMYIEDLRQELRISIALFRNPTFHDHDKQREALVKNIKETQILIVKRCIQIYKFIDYFHDRRKEVPLKYLTQQPPPYILNAFFVKMKADYLRYIYECLSGDNGLLGSKKNHKSIYKDDIELIESRAIKDTDSVDVVDSEIYYSLHPLDGKQASFKDPKEKLKRFYAMEKTLLEFLEHEIVFEYEKVKDQLFDNNRRPKKYPTKEGVLDHEYAEFHPVFLSSLLNQTVFLGDVEDQRYKELMQKDTSAKSEDKDEGQINSSSLAEDKQEKKPAKESDAAIYRRKKENLQKLYAYVLRWTDEIDNFSYIMTMSNKENQETSRSIQNLLERALDSWKDPK